MGIPGAFGITERVGVIIIAIITLIIMIAIIAFLVQLLAPTFIGIFITVIVICAGMWMYTKLKSYTSYRR